MTTPPETDDATTAFFMDITERTDQARRTGADERLLAWALLEAGKETAMRAGLQEFFDHALLMESRGRELREEFEARLGAKLDLAALRRGEVRLIDAPAD
ncbi:MAG: hypothetical protein AAGG47_17865 [Pseudomonadota bacterium]